jgi:putative ABC transport system ATP-binding protein
MDALIELSEVSKRYDNNGAFAVENVSLRVASGESVAVMGPSGSGKSTLLNLIAGLDRPTAGTVTVAGQRIDSLSETSLAKYRRQRVGMIFQFFNLLDDLTVADNVLLPAQLAGASRADARRRADELLDRLKISQHKQAYPARLSGGERQRVAIARALVNSPELLLADEPTGALDTATGEEIGELLLELNQAGQSMIMVTHNADLAVRYASRTIEIVDGRLAQGGLTGGHGSSEHASGHGSSEHASGELASGGVASGGVASGRVASGGVASGGLADGGLSAGIPASNVPAAGRHGARWQS